jgi:hypothetical protein
MAVIPDKVKVWIRVAIGRNSKNDDFTYNYRWYGTDQKYYSPEFPSLPDAINFSKHNELKPYE